MNAKDIDQLLDADPYCLDSVEKQEVLLRLLKAVTEHHSGQCVSYRKFLQKKGGNLSDANSLEELPFLPSSIFKDTFLSSISESEIFREIRSSATSSDRSSRIVLDKSNNLRWIKSLQKMLIDRLGNRRYSLMVVDEEVAFEKSETVSARFSMTKSMLFLAKETNHCLKREQGSSDLALDFSRVVEFFEKVSVTEDVLVFGFTYIVYQELLSRLLEKGVSFDFPRMKLVHAGGWKKLEDKKVSSAKFVQQCVECFGLNAENVVDLYGFSEQGGLLYPTCERGVRHVPGWAEIVVRDPASLESVEDGQEGILQFLTPIQLSYPGHSILTSDLGRIEGRDNCLCGRKGTIFSVSGRADAQVEVRGCGDVMAHEFA